MCQRVQRQHPVWRVDLAIIGGDHATVDNEQRVDTPGGITLTRLPNFWHPDSPVDDVDGDRLSVIQLDDSVRGLGIEAAGRDLLCRLTCFTKMVENEPFHIGCLLVSCKSVSEYAGSGRCPLPALFESPLHPLSLWDAKQPFARNTANEQPTPIVNMHGGKTQQTAKTAHALRCDGHQSGDNLEHLYFIGKQPCNQPVYNSFS
jgi:hypothetical protein